MGSQSMYDKELILLRNKMSKKLTSGKPSPVATYIRRSLNSGIMILELLKDVPFTELSVSLYFITKDTVSMLARVYESELELALIDRDKFLKGIHKFYNETAIYIKKNDMYKEFFAFLSALNREADSIRQNGKKNVTGAVLDAYQSLLLQQLEYLRPDKFNFSTRVCGISTSGELLTCTDYLPDVDTITNSIEEAYVNNKLRFVNKESYMAYVSQKFGECGYRVNSLEDLDMLMERDRIVSYQVSTMLPFSNEYTYDIVGANVESPNCVLLEKLQCTADMSSIKESLKHRAKMLPTNGQIFEVEKLTSETGRLEYIFFKKILLRETFYQDKIYLLYKAETTCGEFCGYYEPMTEDFFTVMQNTSIRMLPENLQRTILYLYACCVLKNGPELLSAIPSTLHYEFEETENGPAFTIPLSVRPYSRGGKLRSAMESVESVSRGPKKGNEQYEGETRAIQGYIRKLGAGHSPSQEAIARAEALGFSLALDETYVQPHLTTVYIRRKDN